MTTVVTGWTGRGYDALGEKFIDTFDRFWPPEVDLTCYVDQPAVFSNRFLSRMTTRPLAECAGLAEFVERHKDNPAHNGRGPNSRWKSSERDKGYSFRWDAVRFATQMFIPEAASSHLPDGEVFAWFDADVVMFAAVSPNFIENMLGDSDLCYLGREPKHSEIGFWACRLNSRSRLFLRGLADIYRSDDVFHLTETHSAFVFDNARHSINIRGRNITPGGHGHVWLKSPLNRFSAHLKGKRKWA